MDKLDMSDAGQASPAGDKSDPTGKKSSLDLYYDQLTEVLKDDLKYTRHVHRWSPLLVFVVLGLLGAMLCEAREFMTNYLANNRANSSNTTDKVAVTIFSLYAAKLAGLVSILAAFFLRRHPHQPVPRKEPSE